MSDERSPLRFPPSQEDVSHVKREPVDRTCPHCNSDDVAAYPTLRYKGWFEVVRCQECLEILDEDEMQLHGFWEPWTEGMTRSR